jgi:hypothetical protein
MYLYQLRPKLETETKNGSFRFQGGILKMDPATYFINRLALEVHPGGYLVQITVLDSDPPRQDQVSDLPEWVFRSRLAIWFVQGEGSIYDRAQAGDLIKKELFLERKPAMTHPKRGLRTTA